MSAALAMSPIGFTLMDTSTGFREADRETLITLKVQLINLVQRMDEGLLRIGKLEETRLTSRDLEELMSDTDTMRAEKKDLEKRVTALEQWQVKIMGAAGVLGVLGGIAVRILLK